MSENAHEPHAESTPRAQSAMVARLRMLGLVLICVFGAGAPIAVSIANGHNAPRQAPHGITLTSDEVTGRALFARTCATCHTLAAVAAVGHVGPNLDILQPSEALVLYAIQHGFARGNGQMPAGTYSGQDATDIAQFVSAVAGR